jgi:Acetylglutamate semialdehyde dehydrogenase
VRLVTANAFAGQELGGVFASLEPFARANRLRPMCKLTEVDWAAEDVDVVFACLPHGVTQESVKELPAHLKVNIKVTSRSRSQTQLTSATHLTHVP